MKLRLPWLLLLGFVIITSCRKNDVPEGTLPDGMIALSFDDTSIDNWYDHLSLLDSLDIKATFYISSYHTLSPLQKDKLRTIQAHGNEIAYHTTNHSDLLKVYARNSMRYVLETEIKPDLKLMRNDGFYPENFAYPYGQHDPFLDRQLLVFFKSVRAVCTPRTYNKSLVKASCQGQVLYSPDIDSRSKISEAQIENLMQFAHDKHDCVMFYAHVIDDPRSNYQVSRDRLRYLASLAKKYNLEFITTKEIAH